MITVTTKEYYESKIIRHTEFMSVFSLAALLSQVYQSVELGGIQVPPTCIK